MAIFVETRHPRLLVQDIKEKIDKGNIDTWSYDKEGDFTHSPSQWIYHAWIRPIYEENRVVFAILGRNDKNLSTVDYAVFKSSLVEELDTQLKYWTEQFRSFSVVERVNSLLSKYLLPELSQEEYDKRREEGLRRISEKIPPGYMDSDKDENKEGDYIIWTEILDKSAEDKKSAIFVTEDLKEDWMEKPKGLTNGPRHELRKEFYDKVPECEFHAYTTAQFLRFADPNHEILTEDDIKDIDSRRQLLKEEKKKADSAKNEESETKNNKKSSGGKNG